MSHLIQNTLPLQGRTLVQFRQRSFVKPNLKKIVRASTQPDDIHSHQQIIDQLCYKLSGREFLRIDKQNQDAYFSYKKKLKNKRNSSIADGSQVIQDIFTRDEERTQEERQRRRNQNHINVLKYLEKMPEKVYLHQRYNNTINQKINILHEIKEIEKKKQTYRKWSNQKNNSPIKNPNFTKMTFLLEKLSSEKNAAMNIGDKSCKFDNEKLTKLMDTANKLKQNSSSNHTKHKHTKSCIPNLTLDPIPKYCSKQSSKWFEDSVKTEDTTLHSSK